MTAVTIERIAGGGDGVGRLPDGMTVFVPRTAPRDVARVEVVSRKARYARGRLLGLDRAGDGRVEPPCPHYRGDACGGCQLQHLKYERQVAAKQRLVSDAVRRIGHRDAGSIAVVPAHHQWRYRSRVTLTVGDIGTGIGFHRYDRPGEVFDLEDCLIAAESLMELWGMLRRSRALLPATSDAIGLREDRNGRRHVVFHGGVPPLDVAPLAKAVEIPEVAYWWSPRRGAVRPLHQRSETAGDSTVPAMAFEQSNRSFAEAIRTEAVAALAPRRGEVVWDLYGGAGDAARRLAHLGAQVWSVDRDRRAVSWAKRFPADGEPADRPRYWAARAEEAVSRLPTPAKVLLNPPRTGAARQVMRHLDRLATRGALRRVVYVSCDPATLARDLARLPAMSLCQIKAFDLFPQTSHVETLAVLEPA